MKLLLALLFGLSIIASAQPSSFSARGIGGGGALFAASINPANNNEYYIACDMGEVFHTSDFGNHYDQNHFTEIIGGHNSKVCYTSTPGLLYSISYANNMIVPLTSLDNGATWSPLSGNPDNTEETFSIDADYNNPNRVIISYYGNIYFSNNGGTTFTPIHTALGGGGNVVGGVFFDGNTIYIGTNDGVLVSTDGGASWNTATINGIPAGEQIWSFGGGKVGSTTRFFCITASSADIYVGLQGSDYYNFATGVYSVDYGSGNWTPCANGINLSTDFPMFVGMAANCIDTVYLAGSSDQGEPNILKTVTGGSSWSHVFNTAGNANIKTGWSGSGGDRGWGYGECPFAIAVAPNNVNRAIFGDFGFVHKTLDGGTNWEQAYVDVSTENPAGANTPTGNYYASIGIENTSCWQVMWADQQNMFSCYSDIRGIRSNDGGFSWSFNYTGLSSNTTYRIAKDISNGNIYAATSNIHDMYQSTRLADAQLDASDSQGLLLYSTNNGQTWQTLHSFGHPVFWISVDPNNSNRAYASVIHYSGGSGVGGIYRTDNLQSLGSSTWTLLPDPPRTEKHPACIEVLNDGKMVCSYSGRRNGSGAFTASSGVFIYDPVGNSWTDVSDAGMYYWTKDIVIDPNDAAQNTWYAGVFSGWGGAPNNLGGLYKTMNRGTSWVRLTDIDSIDRVTSCTFNPANPDEIYMTTENDGLWMSSNINTSSPTFTRVMTYPFQQPERVFLNPYNSNEMWVSSFGNGMKVGSLAKTGIPEFGENNINAGLIYPNPAHDEISIKNTEDFESIEIYNVLGECVMKGNEAKIYNVSELENGTYIVKIKRSSIMEVVKFFIAK